MLSIISKKTLTPAEMVGWAWPGVATIPGGEAHATCIEHLTPSSVILTAEMLLNPRQMIHRRRGRHYRGDSFVHRVSRG